MKNFSFDNLIKSKALEHEAPVPADAWENISREKDRKRPLAFWWITGLLLSVGIGVFGLYQLNRESEGNEKHVAGVTKTSEERQQGTSDGFDEATKGHPGNVNSPATATVPSTTADPVQNTNNTIPGNRSSLEKQESAALITTRKKNGVEAAPVNDLSATNTTGNNNINTTGNEMTAIKTMKQAKRKLNRTPQGTVLPTEPLLTETGAAEIIAAKNRMKKKTGAATKVAIQAPGTENKLPGIENSDVLTDQYLTNTKIRQKIQQSDSTGMVKQEDKQYKKSLPVDSVTAVLQPKKKSNKKRLLYVDASGSAFQPVQQNDRLLSINRTTTGPLSLSEYKANSVRTALDPSFGVTLALRKSIGKKLYLSAGFQYAMIKESVRLEGTEKNTRYSIVKRLSPSGASLIDDTVANSSTGTRIINAVNSYKFLSIPVLFQYDLVAHRSWNLLLAGGFYFNVHSTYQNSIGGELQPFYATAKTVKKGSGFTIDGYAGIRLSKSLGKSFQLFAEPGFQFNFMKYRLPGMINYKNIHRAGLQIGFSYALPY